MLMKVTQDDINQSPRPAAGTGPHPIELSKQCPIARAMSRQLGVVVDVDIVDDQCMAFVKHKGKHVGIDLPKSCYTFVTRWDNHKTVDPINFRVDIPDELQ